jgi:serine/threonine protein kinase
MLTNGYRTGDLPAGHRICGEIGEFVVERFIGKGGFGVVYKATVVWLRDGSLGFDKKVREGDAVAIKVLGKAGMDHNVQKRVRCEIDIHTKLEHPSIVNLLTAFEDLDLIYIVLEFCEGGDLDKAVKKKKGVLFGETECREWVRQVAEGLSYLHNHNIMHRDVSMGNILLTLDGRCKIADFGLAVEMRSKNETHRTMCGTPNAMAPEIATESPYSKEVDVWGLGIILYHLLVGRSPFDTGKVHGTLKNVIKEEPFYPESLSKDSVRVLKGMMHKNLERRFVMRQVISFLKSTTPSSSMTGDSGIGTTTLMSNGQPSSVLSGRGPDFRQPLLPPREVRGGLMGNISEGAEVMRLMGSNRARCTTPIVPQPDLYPRTATTTGYSMVSMASSLHRRPRSASLDRGSAAARRTRTPTPPPTPAATSHSATVLEPPISTARLKETKRPQTIKAGVQGSVLERGEFQADFVISKKSGRSVRERMLVSADGLKVTVEKSTQGRRVSEEYGYTALPRCHWLKYNIVARCVQFRRQLTPKITMHTEQAHCELMENEPPNFHVAFYQGPQLDYSSASNTITFLDDADGGRGGPLKFSYPLTKSSVAGERIYSYLRKFEDWHSQCKTFEKLLLEAQLSVSFPVVIGRKHKSLSSSTSPMTSTAVASPSAAPPPPPHISLTSVRGTGLSLMSRHSQGKDFIEKRFRDGTIFRMPRNTESGNLAVFSYQHANGWWEECTCDEMSDEMTEKNQLVLMSLKEAMKQKSLR